MGNEQISLFNAAAACEDLYAVQLETLDISDPKRFQDGTVWSYFERLRREEPVHYCPDSPYGPYWSVTRYHDIMAVDTNHTVFSSQGGITLLEPQEELRTPMFIAMDQPKHAEQRKAVQGIVSPESLAELGRLIRERVVDIIESLPVNETFDWVERVSIELTTQMLATLFGFPIEDRRLLSHWSDVATMLPQTPEQWDFREAEMQNCLAYFSRLWKERAQLPRAHDLISMMAHDPATQDMPLREFLGNLILLIVGGNDTTRNTISASLHLLNKNPDEYEKLRDDPSLIPGMAAEVIRYQTPLAYMRRRALVDFELGGKTIRAGDKVAMWYISGNRDEAMFERPNSFWIERPNVRRHLAFGFGIHRCMGKGLAELQLKILWEELLTRHPRIEVVAPAVRVASSFVHGIASLPVNIPA
ncbi:MAG: cytochrome P450 [Rhodomicrobium sp.]